MSSKSTSDTSAKREESLAGSSALFAGVAESSPQERSRSVDHPAASSNLFTGVHGIPPRQGADALSGQVSRARLPAPEVGVDVPVPEGISDTSDIGPCLDSSAANVVYPHDRKEMERRNALNKQ